jgi:hypothetical protein
MYFIHASWNLSRLSSLALVSFTCLTNAARAARSAGTSLKAGAALGQGSSSGGLEPALAVAAVVELAPAATGGPVGEPGRGGFPTGFRGGGWDGGGSSVGGPVGGMGGGGGGRGKSGGSVG